VFEVDHHPVEPAFGVRIEYQDKIVVLSGDTRPSENLIKFAQGADLLIHEVAAPREFVERTKDRLPPEMQQKVIAHHTTRNKQAKSSVVCDQSLRFTLTSLPARLASRKY
jgi:ribonuclease Z